MSDLPVSLHQFFEGLLVCCKQTKKRHIPHFQISSNGIIVVEQMSPFQPGDHLDDMEVLGIAPFFAAIDIEQGGEISVSETTGKRFFKKLFEKMVFLDSDVLTRATKTVNENLERPNFVATSVVIITFKNVTTARNEVIF